MIEKVKKLTLLLHHSEKEQFLSKLQSFGLMHLDINPAASSDAIIEVREQLSRIQKAEKLLAAFAEDQHAVKSTKNFESLEELLETVEKVKDQLDHATSERELLKKDLKIATPFGNFDHQIFEDLASRGIKIKIYSASKSLYAKISKLLEVPHEIIYQNSGVVYYALFIIDNVELPENLGVEEKIPEFNVATIQKRLQELDAIIGQAEEQLVGHSVHRTMLQEALKSSHANLHYAFATASLDAQVEDKVFIIEGYITKSFEKKLVTFLDEHNCAYLLEEPSGEDDAPIKLKNAPVARLFEPIGQLFSLPNYNEIDTVPFFAPFFALYFGLCLGDMGYGLLLVGVILVALFFVKNKGFRSILKLGLVLGIFTVLAGFSMNSFFGAELVNGESALSTKFAFIEQLKPFITFGNPDDTAGPMVFAIILGIIQVFLGQILNAFNRFKSLGFQGILQPIGSNLVMIGSVMMTIQWMYKPTLERPITNYMVGPIPLGEMISFGGDPFVVGSYILIAGVVLVMLFNSVGSNFFIRPLIGLWEMYGLITGILGDLLSYIRIFALGLAGGLLGAAFNDIAFMVRDGAGGIGGIVFMLLILVFGHTLNLLLAALGAFVHPLRLTFVEFYKAVGFTGGGKPYTPFTNK